jgi:secreted trypsin-like serine protease
MKAKILSISMVVAASLFPAGARASGITNSLSTVQLVSSPTNATYCGGVLISENYVLTAATCVDAKLPSSFYVKVGNAKNGYAHLPVIDYTEHPDYDMGTCSYANNIAVVHVSVPSTAKALLSTVPLAHVPDGSMLAPGAEAAWFGDPQPVSRYGSSMRYYTMKMMSVTAADSMLKSFIGANVCGDDLPAMMTSDAVSLPGGAGTSGMEGAPLYALGGWNENYVIGLQSWGVSPAYPYVFVDLGAHAQWIAANTQ